MWHFLVLSIPKSVTLCKIIKKVTNPKIWPFWHFFVTQFDELCYLLKSGTVIRADKVEKSLKIIKEHVVLLETWDYYSQGSLVMSTWFWLFYALPRGHVLVTSYISVDLNFKCGIEQSFISRGKTCQLCGNCFYHNLVFRSKTNKLNKVSC